MKLTGVTICPRCKKELPDEFFSEDNVFWENQDTDEDCDCGAKLRCWITDIQCVAHVEDMTDEEEDDPHA